MGIDSDIAVPLEITTLSAWHALSCHYLCHCPSEFNPREKSVWKLIWTSLSSFGDAEILSHGGGVILIHVGKRRILMGGALTTGEMRRTLMTLLGLILPKKMPYPCTEQPRKATEKLHYS